MADEIQVGANIRVVNDGLKDSRSQSNIKYTQTTQNATGGTQNIGTTHEAIALGDLAAAGYMQVLNLDAANFVEIGVDVAATFYPVAKVQPLGVSLFEIADSVTLYAQADTATVKIDKLILDK